MNNDINILTDKAVALLKQLISTPSFSKEENDTAELIVEFFNQNEIPCSRVGNNIYAKNAYYDAAKPSILLNSHHDTVKPNKGYTMDPFTPIVKDGKLFGLGSNDAGGCLVSLMATFLYFYNEPALNHNIVFAASAEEEISGVNGIELVLPYLGNIDFGIVGEPTKLEMAIAERGLMVIDCVAHGRAGHAARNEGENALYKAVDDINWIRNYKFEKVSPLLGESRLSVTIIETENKQHNVVPSQCKYVIDVRVNELYTFEEILDALKQNLQSTFKPRTTRMRSTSIPVEHPLVQAGIALGHGYYGSPTTSDKALMHFPALKMGPGDSARSHTADEYIYLDEIRNGIDTYIKLVSRVVNV
ncbi:M20/M25/M40 family metallo-hydrolase [Ilyomonas limi]|uniref:M20/M25/M40 family metallo-hydrolase n=1 Tax=Ilyomonas limi TaxID=2575867 RepID=A0A4V5UVH1_9BACT|nr:M20 family metallo-hydrolase [Ilyomonas limi]TKK71483.1 M20/M25/M40 family metallo-hydrolase [Ilyomonas limi]